jgi:peroxiredoxin
MKRKTFLLGFIICLCTISVYSQLPIDSQKIYTMDSLYRQMERKQQENIGKQFPQFHAVTLNGETFTESNLKGKVTLINFWFEFCSPCIAEFDALNDLVVQFKGNTKFQFISFTSDTEESAKISVEKYHLLFPVLCIHESECFRLNFNSGFPTSIIIDETGKILVIKSGGSLDKTVIEPEIQKLAAVINRQLSGTR